MRFRNLLPPVVLALALSPSAVWIALDEHVWPWDQAWYGQVTVELFYTLLLKPREWPAAMIHAFGIKAPGIAWIGQWFVPFGNLVGSIDRVLLVSILLTQLATLWMVFAALRGLSGRNYLIPFAVALNLASLPLFVGLTHQYLVEPLQTFVVAWFVLLVARGKQWHPVTLALQLVAASALGILAKVTSPLYCLVPGLVTVWYLIQAARHARLSSKSPDSGELAGKIWLGSAATVLVLGALGWYVVNGRAVADFTALAYSSPVAVLYGAHDTFLNKLGYWLAALRINFAYAPVAVCAAALLLLAMTRRLARRSAGFRARTLDVCALIAVVQITLTIAVFSAGDNEENRYLMPLAPYLAVILCWTLVQLRHWWASAVVITFSVGQLFAANSRALELSPVSVDTSAWLTPVSRDVKRARIIDTVVDATCTSSSARRYSIIGVEEPWFNANTMAYESAKQHESAGLRCYYTSLGYAETDTDRAWDRLLALDTLYFVTLSPEVDLTTPEALRHVSTPVLQRVEGSGLFKPLPMPDEFSVILLRRDKH
jgi:hypothetical protein